MKKNITDKYILKNQHIRLMPMPIDELKDFITNPPYGIDDTARELLSQINLNKAEELFTNRSSNFFWYTCWKVILHQKNASEELVGFAFFHGPAISGLVEASFFTIREFRNRHFGKEMLQSLAEWAFGNKGVYEVEAYVDKDNIPALHSLTSAKFVFRNREHQIERYSIVKSPEYWKGIYMIIGVWIGLALGVVIGNMPIGFGIGLVAGFAAGTGMEVWAKKRRAAIMNPDVSDKSKFD